MWVEIVGLWQCARGRKKPGLMPPETSRYSRKEKEERKLTDYLMCQNGMRKAFYLGRNVWWPITDRNSESQVVEKIQGNY